MAVASDLVLDVLTVAVLLWFGSRLLVALRRTFHPRVRQRSLYVTKGIRFRHVVAVPFLLTAVAIVAVALLQVPGLSFGWWTAIGGVGNPVTGTTERTIGTPLEYLLPLVFLALLIPSLPLFVESEERMFRQGAEHWSRWKRLWKAVVFGLVHALVGIPVGVALALTVGGLWFTRAYLRGYAAGGAPEALLESTRAHLAYNLTIVAVVLALLAYDTIAIALGGA